MTFSDVFFSYARTDATRVRPVVDALREAGLDVWFDENDASDFTSITSSLRDGLSASKALLCWYSPAYPLRRACQWELTAAFLAGQREGDPRHRVLLLNPEPRAEHVHPVQLRDQKYLSAPMEGDVAGCRAAAQAVRGHVDRLTGTLGAISPWTPATPFGYQPLSTPHFVGRLQELWEIHSLLQSSSAAAITGSAGSGLAQVFGMGGVGKSLLAEEYALRFATAYPGGVFWLRGYGFDDARGDMTPEAREAERDVQLRQFALNLGLPVDGQAPDVIRASLGHSLRTRNQACLWVVDDLPAGLSAQQIQGWLPPDPVARTLMTTRSREYFALFRSLELDVLPPDDALRLLTHRWAPESENELSAAEAIIQELSCHALALDVAGSFLAKSRLRTYQEYLQDLRRPDKDALKLAEKLAGVLPAGHSASISLTLLQSSRTLGETAKDLLRLGSVAAQAALPQRMILGSFRLLASDDGLELAESAIAQTTEASLAQVREDGSVSIHSLVARCMRWHDEKPERRAIVKSAAVDWLNEILPGVTDARKRAMYSTEVTHARELAATPGNPEEALLLGWVGRFDYERGDYSSAARVEREVMSAFHRLLGSDHRLTLTSMNNLAGTLQARGDLAGARDLQERVLTANQRLFGDDHPDTLRSTHNLALTLQEQGDLVGARALQERVLDASRRLLGDEHPNTLASMNNLATTLRDQGESAGARALQELALATYQRLLGDEHPNTLKSMGNLGLTLRAEGDLAGALLLHERVLEANERLLGSEHPDTLTSTNNLADTLWQLGKVVEARRLEERVLEARKRMLGCDHPATLTSMSNLAGTLWQQGDLVEARVLQEHVLASRQRLLGDEHPDTLTSTNNLAETLRAQGDLAGARKLQERVLASHERLLGEKHPNTSGAAWNLFTTALQMKDQACALEIFQRDLVWLLAADRFTLGAVHQEIRSLLLQFLAAIRQEQ